MFPSYAYISPRHGHEQLLVQLKDRHNTPAALCNATQGSKCGRNAKGALELFLFYTCSWLKDVLWAILASLGAQCNHKQQETGPLPVFEQRNYYFATLPFDTWSVQSYHQQPRPGDPEFSRKLSFLTELRPGRG